MEFLYSGENPIQTGVIPGTIETRRIAVVRGKVLDKADNPLPGVTLTILDHPEFGQTLSRADGMFDMAVNGGGLLNVVYTKPGYLPAQRQVETPWQDYVWLPDAVLLPYDQRVTAINLGGSNDVQVARGSAITDKDGMRQATLFFQPDTQANMSFAAGSVVAQSTLSTMHVRATEYTVGDNGPEAMPAPLPPNAGYTYAVEFSVDEAVAASAVDVQFDRPVINYLENFLNFPVGMIVPVGYYDKAKAAWIPSDNGRVVKVMSIANGLAELDTDGDSAVDNGVVITPTQILTITTAERQHLAQLYQPGQSLWRVSITHFTPWDLNYPYAPPPGATAPRQRNPEEDKRKDKPCIVDGSSIECQNQVLGEALDVVGTPFRLHYVSDRAPGRKTAYTLQIPLSGSTVPTSLLGIDLKILVAGRQFTHTVDSEQPCVKQGASVPENGPSLVNQSYTFTWDGKDAYGRTLQGHQPIEVRIGYVYCPVYVGPPSDVARSFARYGDVPMTTTLARDKVTLWQVWKGAIGPWDALQQALGGWSLSIHHAYDPIGRELHLGDGRRRTASDARPTITTVAGGVNLPYFTPNGIVVAPDGTFYVADAGRQLIHHVEADGTTVPVVGNGTLCPEPTQPCGDGGPAIQAQLFLGGGWLVGMALAPDGSLYFADRGNNRVRRVGRDGIITTVAGNGIACYSHFPGTCGDGGPAIQAQLSMPTGIALGPDGMLYVADYLTGRIRQIGLDGTISTVISEGDLECMIVAGIRVCGTFFWPTGLALGADGSLYFANVLGRVYKLGTDGTPSRVVGLVDQSGCTSPLLKQPMGLTLGQDGSLYIAEQTCGYIWHLNSDGLSMIAGTVPFTGQADPQKAYGEGGPATQAQLFAPTGIAVGADGNLYIADWQNGRVRKVTPGWQGFTGDDIVIPAEDGSEIYVFNGQGRHLRTLEALTNAVLYRFSYDTSGHLTKVEDGDGNTTRIERDSSSQPTAIVGPYGQRTQLSLDANGYLASVTDPAGEVTRLTYTPNGLLTQLIEPKSGIHQFNYDELGRLAKDQNPAGAYQTLARVSISNSTTITLSTAMNRSTAYGLEELTSGAERRTNTFADGTQTQVLIGTDGGSVATIADGTVMAELQGPDPRFGMQAPLAKSAVITTPSGLKLTLAITRAVTLADPLDISTLQSQADTVSINGHLYTTLYQTATHTFVDTTPLGRSGTTTIDAQGRISKEQVSGLLPLSYVYDNRGRLVTATQGNAGEARMVSLGYNASGYVETITDPLSQVVRFAYDQAGRVTTQTLPDGRQILYSYDANGNVTSITPPGRPAHTFTYTADDLVATYAPPDLGAGSNQTSYTYNLDRQVTRVSRPDGKPVDFSYDSGGRLSAVTLARGQLGYTYQANSGQLATITAPDGGALAYTYDGSLLTGQTWSGAVVGSVQYGYDNDFRLASLAVNGGNAVTFSYDDDGLLTRAGDLLLSHDMQNGLLTGTTMGNVTDAWSYNSFGEPLSYRATYNGANLFVVQYSYDKLGRLTVKTETVAGQTTRYNYGYDLAGRLVEVKKNNVVVATYTYDSNGNRLSYTGSSGTVNGTYDNQDRLLQYGNTAYTYTANGELLSKTSGGQTTTYTYDELGNLIGVNMPDGTKIEYLIDGQNRRIGKKVNGVLVQGFLYQDQISPIAELDGSGNIVARFIYGSRINVPNYMVKGGVIYQIIADYLGSPRLVVNPATGEVIQHVDYDEFGNVLQNIDPAFQPFGFAGGIYDRHTNLTRFGMRDYDAIIGRWTAKDSISFGGGDSNLYRYALGNPVNIIDLLGLDALFFDGTRLTLTDNKGRIADSWPATSGKGSSFYKDCNLQLWKNAGPTPENDYFIRTNEIQWLGQGDEDWGDWRVPIHVKTRKPIGPRGFKVTRTRGFYIHGGTIPGSSGCIDLAPDERPFFKKLMGQYNNRILKLIVRYNCE